MIPANPVGRDRGAEPTRRLLVALVAAGLVATGGSKSAPLVAAPEAQAAQSPPAQPAPDETPRDQQPVFQTGVNFVRVDVIVSDRDNRTIEDLTADDFEVFEDDQPQQIETFRFIKLTGAPAAGDEPAREIRSDYVEAAEAARDDVRLFAIFLDDYHVRRGASLGVREPLMQFVQNLGPLDMVGLMYPLTPVGDVRFTRSKAVLAGAIEQFMGRKYDYEPRNEIEAQYANAPVETVERIRNEVSLSALKGLVTRLGGMREGRKAVVVVSEGFTYYVPQQLRSPDAQMAGLFRGRGGAGTDDTFEDRARFMSQADIQRDLRSVYDAANRANAAIYTLDPRGLAPFEFDINEGVNLQQDQASLRETTDTLRILADETDGRAIVNRNDLGTGLKQIVQDSSAYYLIGYTSSRAPADGKFHEIKVRVKRPRVQVRARKGYWALTAEESARAETPVVETEADREVSRALAALESPRRARLIRTWIGATRGDNGRTRVTFVWEPVVGASGERPARLTVTAAGGDGTPYFRGRVPEQVTTTPNATAPGGRAEFHTGPGTIQLRLSIEDASGRVVDTDIVEAEVPDYTAPEIRLSTPELYRARTLPELRRLTADPTAMPTADRTFRRTDRLLVRFAAFAPGDAPVTCAMAVLSTAGRSVHEVTLETPTGDGPREAVVPLAGLSPGDYLLEVAGQAGDERKRALVAFRVTG